MKGTQPSAFWLIVGQARRLPYTLQWQPERLPYKGRDEVRCCSLMTLRQLPSRLLLF
jgi:hypothetical protein